VSTTLEIYEELKDLIAYDEKSPSYLRWVENVKWMHHGRLDYVTPILSDQGYSRLRYKNKYIFIHRLIWTLFSGSVPDDLQIDHIDGDKQNNNIGNLRLVSNKVNCQNRGMRKDCKTGAQGVTLAVDKYGNRSYKASWTSSGKWVSKWFSCNILGEAQAFSAAKEFRQEQLRRLNCDGETYTARHGK